MISTNCGSLPTVIGKVFRLSALLCLLAAQALSATGTNPDTLSFRRAIELALQHSGVMGIATMNQWRAEQVYKEARANYIPQITIGSGLGYSYGFPLTLEGSAPSAVNFNSVQSLFNLSLRQFIKAAHIDWRATDLDVQDKRNAVILDAALTYAQLEQLANKIQTLTEAENAAHKAQSITQQRLEQGVDSQLDLTRSQLVAARIRLRLAEAQGQADVEREHLAKLVGLPADAIALEADSMPQLPPVSQEADLSSVAASESPAVKLAEQKALAADARAKGEHKATTPTVDLASQYAFLARYNNYDLYYNHYTANNFSGGLNIRFPIFNPVQRAKASEADAEAIIAHKQADLAKNQVAEDTLKLQRSIRQLAAASDVAKLEWEVSQGDMEGVKSRVETGNANVRDQQNAQLDVEDKHAAYLDAEFELAKAELQLLRLTGELENWAIPAR